MKTYKKYLIAAAVVLYALAIFSISMSYPSKKEVALWYEKLGNETLGYKIQPKLKHLSKERLVKLANNNRSLNDYQLINIALRIIANDICMEKDIHKDYGLNQSFFERIASTIIITNPYLDRTSRILLVTVFEKDIRERFRRPARISAEKHEQNLQKIIDGLKY